MTLVEILKKLSFMRKTNYLLVILLLLMGFAGHAQETTSEMQGNVTGNGILAGATVTAVHVPTGTKYATSTRKDGHFNIANILK